MQAIQPGKVQSAINVTPLVDVVLVLLIIFMVVVPQLQAGPAVDLPATERPPARTDDEWRIVVALERGGLIWVDDAAVSPEAFVDEMLRVAERCSGCRVVIKGDARLSFGEVRRTMFAVESAGFADVGLITERRDGAD